MTVQNNTTTDMDSQNNVDHPSDANVSQKETTASHSNGNGPSVNADKGKNHSRPQAAVYDPRVDGSTTPLTPASPNFYASFGAYMDPAVAAEAYQQALAAGFDPNNPNTYAAYMYPMSPQFPVQYYADYSDGTQSYPGSPPMQPQSPPFTPTSPFFSPQLNPGYYQQLASPPQHPAYMLPPHFPAIHMPSPVLSGIGGTMSAPSSPPQQHIRQLPGPFQGQNNGQRGIHHGQHQQQQGQQGQQSQYPRRHSTPHNNAQPGQQQQVAQQNNAQAQTHSLNIYIRGLPPSITDEALYSMCALYGKISSSKAIIDQKSGECKGYGFVMYETENEAKQAIDALNSTGLQVSFAKVGQESFSTRLKNLQDENSTNIYISNLPIEMTEQQLEELFLPYKTVSNRILRDPQTGLSRGVGFSRMADRNSAVAVINKYNSHTLPGSSVPLQVRFADSIAQKKLKGQTARKRMWRAREFQNMNMQPFARPLQMPVTPETMLGIAAAAQGQPGQPSLQYYAEGLVTGYPGQPYAAYPQPGAVPPRGYYQPSVLPVHSHAAHQGPFSDNGTDSPATAESHSAVESSSNTPQPQHADAELASLVEKKLTVVEEAEEVEAK
ncbi:hypothetical protein BC936DRAFT_138391 [Jimgerdemannia flammicorona]|uniref:RRM domain-containing protein n=1 Tax=Jimgerdemannia flammicorona TaxID=994334 RepID=A0A433CJD5_9FUNG|nr:hypothetical protein BC936DRAFT_138391 [Jimgerdemannia flammicorona]